MKKIPKKFLLIPLAFFLILVFVWFLYPKETEKIPPKITETFNNISKKISESFSFIPKPSNETLGSESKNETINETGNFTPQFLVPLGGTQAKFTKLLVKLIYCKDFLEVLIKNIGTQMVDFSNAEFYHENEMLGVYIPKSFLYPNEEEKVLIFLPHNMTLPPEGEWSINLILKDDQNITTFNSSFVLYCV